MIDLEQEKSQVLKSYLVKDTSSSLLDSLCELSLVQAIDCISARRLAEPLSDEGVLLLFAYLFSASRQGHLCVKVVPDLYPPLKQVWVSETKTLSDEESAHYNQFIQEAYQAIPSSFFQNNERVVLDQGLLYLHKNWSYENEILNLFHNWEKKEPKLKLKNLELAPMLLKEQKGAIKTSLMHCVSFITGGPGVGKTFTASHLIHSYIKKFPEARIALVAPTGKAVANLHGQFLKFFEEGDSAQNIEVFTLHKLFSKKIYSYLSYDLILIDESSMISVSFMRKLLQYAKPASRMIFLGDPNQLPPIESGFIFQDLLTLSNNQSHLSTCVRSELQSLITAAKFVKEGDTEQFTNYLQENSNFFTLDPKKKNLFYERILPLFPRNLSSFSSRELIEAFQEFKLLSPVRRGVFGVDQVNYDLKELFSKAKIHPILITSNDYRLELFNGDIGILIGQTHALFIPRKIEESYYDPEERVRLIPYALLPSFEYAYCVSVHKSQGSEYARVALLLPSSSEVFGREMLYTAITRAKKSFEIFGDLTTVKKILKCSAIRYSGIQAKVSYE